MKLVRDTEAAAGVSPFSPGLSSVCRLNAISLSKQEFSFWRSSFSFFIIRFIWAFYFSDNKGPGSMRSRHVPPKCKWEQKRLRTRQGSPAHPRPVPLPLLTTHFPRLLLSFPSLFSSPTLSQSLPFGAGSRKPIKDWVPGFVSYWEGGLHGHTFWVSLERMKIPFIWQIIEQLSMLKAWSDSLPLSSANPPSVNFSELWYPAEAHCSRDPFRSNFKGSLSADKGPWRRTGGKDPCTCLVLLVWSMTLLNRWHLCCSLLSMPFKWI